MPSDAKRRYDHTFVHGHFYSSSNLHNQFGIHPSNASGIGATQINDKYL